MTPIIVAGLLAVAGMLLTLRAPQTARAKGVWLGFFLLVGLGLMALLAVQQEAAQHMVAERDALLAKTQDPVGQLLSMVNTPTMDLGPPQLYTAFLNHLDVKRRSQKHSDDLKLEASYLAVQILEFLAERHQNEPPPLQPLTWFEDVESHMRYLRETMTSFSEKFGPKVVVMRNRLATQVAADKVLDLYYDHPVNPTEIRVTAERIGALAQRLP